MHSLQLSQAVPVHEPPLAHVAAAQVGGVVQAHTAALAAVALHCMRGRVGAGWGGSDCGAY